MPSCPCKSIVGAANENDYGLRANHYVPAEFKSRTSLRRDFSKSETEVFTVSKFNDKDTADKIMSLMRDELKEIAKGSKMTVLEGPLLIQG